MRVHAVLTLLGAAGCALASPIDAPPPPRVTPVFVPPQLSARDLSRRAPSVPSSALYTSSGCLRKNVTALMMNDILASGGAGAKLALCPSQRYDLNNTLCATLADRPADREASSPPRINSSTRSVIVRRSKRGCTDRAAKGTKRATLRVVGPDMSVAIYGARDSTDNLQIRSVTIDGNRPAMGVLPGSAALIEIGGVRSHSNE